MYSPRNKKNNEARQTIFFVVDQIIITILNYNDEKETNGDFVDFWKIKALNGLAVRGTSVACVVVGKKDVGQEKTGGGIVRSSRAWATTWRVYRYRASHD